MKTVCSLVIILALIGCVGMAKYPDTPMGQATFYTGSYHKLVDQYNTEAATITDPDYRDKYLSPRRAALANAAIPIKSISNAVKTGQPITAGMLDAANIALNQIKQYLISRQGVPPTKSEVEAMALRARVTQEVTAQGWESVLLALIELAQAMYPLWQQLNEQANMTQEQLTAEFEMQHAWIMTFDPATDLVALQ